MIHQRCSFSLSSASVEQWEKPASVNVAFGRVHPERRRESIGHAQARCAEVFLSSCVRLSANGTERAAKGERSELVGVIRTMMSAFAKATADNLRLACQPKLTRALASVSEGWCGREDLNLHDLAATSS